LQGLKSKIQELLVYFPEEPRNLEELFGRAQKVDREYWNQQERSFHFRTGLHTRNNMVKRDRDGDIQMVGAKVDHLGAEKRGTKQDVVNKKKIGFRISRRQYG
jgi:hypothetical protein